MMHGTTDTKNTQKLLQQQQQYHMSKGTGLAPCPTKSPGLFPDHFIPRKRSASTHWTGTKSVYHISKEKNKDLSTLPSQMVKSDPGERGSKLICNICNNSQTSFTAIFCHLQGLCSPPLSFRRYSLSFSLYP
jgi:hypothetical protein